MIEQQDRDHFDDYESEEPRASGDALAEACSAKLEAMRAAGEDPELGEATRRRRGKKLAQRQREA